MGFVCWSFVWISFLSYTLSSLRLWLRFWVGLALSAKMESTEGWVRDWVSCHSLIFLVIGLHWLLQRHLFGISNQVDLRDRYWFASFPDIRAQAGRRNSWSRSKAALKEQSVSIHTSVRSYLQSNHLVKCILITMTHFP